jgi:hypothetical protein
MQRLVVLLMASVSAATFAGEVDVAALYEVSTEGTTRTLKAGESGKFVIDIKMKGGAHVSDEAPLKIELSSKQSTLAKQKLTLADSLNKRKAGEVAYPDPRFEVEFTPATQGETSVEAKLIFFVCTEKLCARQTKQLSVPVQVL